MDKTKKIKILHDLKRIALTMVELSKALDRLYEDIENGGNNVRHTKNTIHRDV